MITRTIWHDIVLVLAAHYKCGVEFSSITSPAVSLSVAAISLAYSAVLRISSKASLRLA
jgi:hypothetical protein